MWALDAWLWNKGREARHRRQVGALCRCFFCNFRHSHRLRLRPVCAGSLHVADTILKYLYEGLSLSLIPLLVFFPSLSISVSVDLSSAPLRILSLILSLSLSLTLVLFSVSLYLCPL